MVPLDSSTFGRSLEAAGFSGVRSGGVPISGDPPAGRTTADCRGAVALEATTSELPATYLRGGAGRLAESSVPPSRCVPTQTVGGQTRLPIREREARPDTGDRRAHLEATLIKAWERAFRFRLVLSKHSATLQPCIRWLPYAFGAMADIHQNRRHVA